MIVIIDYGLGNIQAFVNVYKSLHILVKVAKVPTDLVGATKLILPGVGAFDHAMQSFNDSGMRSEVERLVLAEKIPVLGICVGMQMLANTSDEGHTQGLGWVSGKVTSFTSHVDSSHFPTPHMGWNDVVTVPDNALFKGLVDDARFYFLHSYFFECANIEESIATADYGLSFSCAVVHQNIYGVQFHPEKSHHFGVQLLKNFAEI
jgi:glutamine amidotransferase